MSGSLLSLEIDLTSNITEPVWAPGAGLDRASFWGFEMDTDLAPRGAQMSG